MLANVLAVLLGSGSLVFYLAAFFYPEVHRRFDFLWSGLGLFYAVVLWFCAGQMTGTILLGQVTAVSLLLGLGWQTLTVRREKTPVYQQTPVVVTPERVGNWAKSKLNQLRIAPAATVPVQLEKRQLGDRFDPRRRPLYEYEFVEDGVGDVEPTVSSGATVEIAPQSSLPILEPAAEPTDAAPPSAEAEVLLVEESEPDPLLLDQPEDDPTDLTQDATEVSVEETSANSGSDQVARPQAAVFTEKEEVLPEDAEPTATNLSPEEWDEDWDSEFSEPETLKLEKSEDVLGSAPLPEKPQRPSLLATPLILIGWIKDVTGSLTRPKPSKPVIVIPRRDAPASPDLDRIDHSRVQPRPSQPGLAQTRDDVTNTPLESVQAGSESAAWEESNWDD